MSKRRKSAGGGRCGKMRSPRGERERCGVGHCVCGRLHHEKRCPMSAYCA